MGLPSILTAMNLNENFATHVRKNRNKKGWSQDELGERAGLTRNYVGMIERCETSVTLDALSAIAAAFDVDPESLIKKL